MLKEHPKIQDFENFFGGSSRPVRRPFSAQVMRHLLADCPVCRDRLSYTDLSQGYLSRLFRPGSEGYGPDPEAIPAPAVGAQGGEYNQAFAGAERAMAAFLSPEREISAETVDLLLAELGELQPGEQIARIHPGSPYVLPAVVRRLIDRSHALRTRDAHAMLHLAELARLAAEACSAAEAGSAEKLADLRLRAWASYGNALRVSSQPQPAAAAFATAQEYQTRGTRDPALRAWLIEKVTPLAIFQGDYDRAIEMCEEAGQIYQDLGERSSLASTRTQKAIALIYAGETEAALRTLNQAIPLIDPEDDPHLLLSACHNLIRCYIDLDRPDQALTLYSEIRELYQDFDDPLILLRAAWQEGKLLCDLGHLRAAETVLLRVRKGYMEKGIASEVALVSLDLATVYVKLGLVDEVKRTVITTLPIFHALRVKLDTLAALLQLQQVADQEQQALELVRALSSRIESLPKKNAAR
jgi:tetratricopeptide (TPR) repeat protein